MTTCCRCGKDAHAGARLCGGCRRPRISKPAYAKGAPLTFREEQVTALVAQGKPNKEVAHLLGLTEGTVKEYMHRIFTKVGVGNRTELAVRFVQACAGNAR